MIKSTYIIGKHFDIKSKYQKKRCCICGDTHPCVDKKDVIKSSFMDHEWLCDSKYICIYCAACVGYQMSRAMALRTTSFVATDKYFKRLKKNEVWQYVEAPPATPYVLAVTFSNKKHIAFKSILSPGGMRFVSTDKGNVVIDFNKELIKIIKSWYSVIGDTKQEPTAFTKKDILYGSSHHSKMGKYGASKYFAENQFLNKFRGTESLNLLVYLLNKQKGV